MQAYKALSLLFCGILVLRPVSVTSTPSSVIDGQTSSHSQLWTFCIAYKAEKVCEHPMQPAPRPSHVWDTQFWYSHMFTLHLEDAIPRLYEPCANTGITTLGTTADSTACILFNNLSF